MNIKPLFDRVLIKPEQKSVSESGILIPASAGERPQMGKIVAIGSGINMDGTNVGMQVEVGQNVLFNKFVGVEVKIEDCDYILISQIDLVGVIDE